MFWTILNIFLLIAGIYIFWLIIRKFMLNVRNKYYQKLWNEEKARRIKIDPAITRQQLCEQYVMFCKRNNCIVEF